MSFVNKSGCQCEGDKRKREKKEANRPWQTRKRIFKAIVLIVLWGIFAWLAMKISTIEVTHEEYDPYKILGLDQVTFLFIFVFRHNVCYYLLPFRVLLLPKSKKLITNSPNNTILIVEEMKNSLMSWPRLIRL